MEKNTKKRIFSGVQPSGNLHIGNYLGAIKQWADIYADYDSVFCVVDYHAITVPQDPKLLQKKVIEIAKIYIASGIDPKKAIIFQQSHVRAHVELGWILNTIARNNDLTRMTQFKDKSGVQLDDAEYYFAKVINEISKHNDTTGFEKLNPEEKLKKFTKYLFLEFQNVLHVFNKVGVGLYDYPVLMAADILLYNTDVVPVGDDQLQHVELARDLAKRFNHDYTNVFKLPEAKILKAGARIMGLDNPEKKMSKSAKSELNRIELLDDPKSAVKKIMKATTDLGSEVKYDMETKPGISNLLTIYSLLAKQEIKDLEKKYAGKLYGEFKKDLAEVVAEFLVDFQKKYNQISDETVQDILAEGARQAEPVAEATLVRVKKAIGIC